MAAPVKTLATFLVLATSVAACTADVDILTEDAGRDVRRQYHTTSRSLSGCHGQASSLDPA